MLNETKSLPFNVIRVFAFHINSQHELQWKKKETIFVQDNLSEVVKSWASLVTEK